MPKKKKNFIGKNIDISWQKQLEKLCKNLYYSSETDSPIASFQRGKVETVSKESLLSQINENDSEVIVRELDFKDFFARLTKIEDWFGDEEKESAEKFYRIQQLLENNLTEVKVFKVGQIELDIYVVGLDSRGVLSGIWTKAVET